jgi:hypothetical protein
MGDAHWHRADHGPFAALDTSVVVHPNARHHAPAFPYSPTLEGQYIIKNLVLVCAAIVVGSTVRGGTLQVPAPEASKERTT